MKHKNILVHKEKSKEKKQTMPLKRTIRLKFEQKGKKDKNEFSLFSSFFIFFFNNKDNNKNRKKQ